MRRVGIEGIYLDVRATLAKGSTTEDPGSNLASYPLSQVPDEASGLVRAVLAADRNQLYLRIRMSEKGRAGNPPSDFRPIIISDADTGHGGDPHVPDLIRRFVEAGVPGYHIEDQRPGTKNCGHQGGKVLDPSDEQIEDMDTVAFQPGLATCNVASSGSADVFLAKYTTRGTCIWVKRYGSNDRYRHHSREAVRPRCLPGLVRQRRASPLGNEGGSYSR